jgi:hypothetical protein
MKKQSIKKEDLEEILRRKLNEGYYSTILKNIPKAFTGQKMQDPRIAHKIKRTVSLTSSYKKKTRYILGDLYMDVLKLIGPRRANNIEGLKAEFDKLKKIRDDFTQDLEKVEEYLKEYENWKIPEGSKEAQPNDDRIERIRRRG